MSFEEEDVALPNIKDVVLGNTIGQGAFGCVKTAYIESNPSVIIAVKFINLKSSKEKGRSENDITKEVVLHSKCSKHPNILRLIDCNISNDYLWIILEMADGGDLFDKIEPDVGVDTDIAQFYFKQLVNAISYLHNDCGVAHRDIKPENILLDKNGNLKLADFGLASKFKRKDGTKRVSIDQRGSYPYMAPEILNSENPSYYADATDVWSIGILIFVLLTGEIPWEIPNADDDNFISFIRNNGKLNMGPWGRIQFNHLNLLRKILQPIPQKRVTLDKLKLHPWFIKKIEFANSQGLCNNPSMLAKKLFSNLRISLSNESYEKFTQDMNMTTFKNTNSKFSATQPLTTDFADIEHDTFNARANPANTQIAAFSQYVTSDLITNNQDTFMTQEAKWTQYINNDIANLQFNNVKNFENFKDLKFNPIKLAKFYTIEPMDVLLPLLETSLSLNKINVKYDLLGSFNDLIKDNNIEKVFPVVIKLKTKDRRGNNLSGSISIMVVDHDLKCIHIQRKSGDPLEWRRLFKRIALCCRDIIYTTN